MSDQKRLFDVALYPKKAVESAAESFAEWARFSISEKDGKIMVSVSPEVGMRLDDEFWGEFSNHVLAQIA